MNAAESEMLPVERLKRWLQSEVMEQARNIGDPGYCWTSLKDYNDQEMAAYARGVETVLARLSERGDAPFDLDLRQLRAAVGERLRRVGSRKQRLHSRFLNRLAETIRDKRIAMLSRYEALDYNTEFKPLARKLERWERTPAPAPASDSEEKRQQLWEEHETVRRELDALWKLWHELLNDRDWYSRHFELRNVAKEQKAEPVVAAEGQGT